MESCTIHNLREVKMYYQKAIEQFFSQNELTAESAISYINTKMIADSTKAKLSTLLGRELYERGLILRSEYKNICQKFRITEKKTCKQVDESVIFVVLESIRGEGYSSRRDRFMIGLMSVLPLKISRLLDIKNYEVSEDELTIEGFRIDLDKVVGGVPIRKLFKDYMKVHTGEYLFTTSIGGRLSLRSAQYIVQKTSFDAIDYYGYAVKQLVARAGVLKALNILGYQQNATLTRYI